MTIPIEFEVSGRPSSVNGTSAKKAAWQTKVSIAGNAALAQKFAPPALVPPPHVGDVTVKVFFFPSNDQYLDIDNGLKHTIDALCPPAKGLPSKPHAPILANDGSAVRLIAERFPPIPKASLIVPARFAPTLARALKIANGQAAFLAGGPTTAEYATAIKFEAYIANNGALW